MNSGQRSYGKNTIINFIGNAILVVVIMVGTPLLINAFGNDLYGLWRIAMLTLVSYAAILDMGLTTSTKRQLGDAMNLRNYEKAKNILGLSFIYFSFCGLIAILFLVSTTFWLPQFLSVSDEYVFSFKFLLVCVGIFVYLSFLRAIFGSLFVVWARYDLSQFSLILNKVLLFVFTLALICLPISKLVAAGIAAVFSVLIVILVAYFFAKNIWKDLTFSFSFKDKSIIKHFFSFGGYGMLILLGPILVHQTQPLIIGQMMSLKDVTFYSAVFVIISQMNSVSSACSSPLFPIVNKHKNDGKTGEIKKVYAVSLRRNYFMLSIFAIPLCIYAGSFFKYWINLEFENVKFILWVMIINIVALPLAYTASNVLTASGDIKKLGIYGIIGGIFSIALSYILIIFTDFGLLGVAFAASFPYLVISVLNSLELCKQIKTNFIESIVFVVWIIPISLISLIIAYLINLFHSPENLFETLVYLSVMALIVASLGIFTLLSKSDRKNIFKKLISMKEKIF